MGPKDACSLPPDSFSSTVWEAVIEDLKGNGISVLDLNNPDLESISKNCFSKFRRIFPLLVQHSPCHIPDGVDAAHATGFHGTASANNLSSRYNRYREGLVFSDGCKINNYPSDDNGLTFSGFQANLDALEDLLHAISQNVLSVIEKDLKLKSGWFYKNMGNPRSGSQWHLKSYLPGSTNEDRLASHTDPSLISIVILGRPGVQQGAQGLEYLRKVGHTTDHHATNTEDDGHAQNHAYRTKTCEWTEVARSGHGAAIVLVGSVLSYLTGSYYPASRHCVRSGMDHDHHRMAATLFVRPVGAARLVPPPSPCFAGVIRLKRNLTFEEWNARVSKNYKQSKSTSYSGVQH